MKGKESKTAQRYSEELQRLREHPTGQARHLTVAEAAARLGTSVDWLYRHWRKIPGAYKLSPKQLRFKEHELDAFIRGDNNGATETFDKEGDHAGTSVEER